MLSPQDVADLLRHPENMDAATLDMLRNEVEMYPAFHAARILLLENTLLIHPEERERAIRECSRHVPCTDMLQEMVERSESLRRSNFLAADRTMAVLNNFLGTDGADDELRPEMPAATDYLSAAGFSIGDSEESDDVSDPLLDSLIAGSAEGLNLRPEPRDNAAAIEPVDGGMLNENLFTETLAAIYIRQQRYEEAIEIIRSLSLTFPNKSSYFADQIRYLEKLLEVNKQKKK